MTKTVLNTLRSRGQKTADHLNSTWEIKNNIAVLMTIIFSRLVVAIQPTAATPLWWVRGSFRLYWMKILSKKRQKNLYQATNIRKCKVWWKTFEKWNEVQNWWKKIAGHLRRVRCHHQHKEIFFKHSKDSIKMPQDRQSLIMEDGFSSASEAIIYHSYKQPFWKRTNDWHLWRNQWSTQYEDVQ